VVIVFGVLATINVPLFAFVWLVVFFVVAFVAVVALWWGLVAASRAVGGRLWRRWLHAAKRQGARRSVPLRPISGPHSARSASVSGSKRSRKTA
jgi:hypothetical protein